MTSGMDKLLAKSLRSEYRRRINAEAVLDYYGAQNRQELVKQDGSHEVIHSCLLDHVEPHHNNGDANPSASMNLDKKVYSCYAYWGGDIFQLIMKMEQATNFIQILPIIEKFLDESTQEKEQFLSELEKYFDNTEISEEHSTYSPRVLEPWAFTHPYMVENRGISPEVTKRLQVGYDIKQNRVVIPIFFEGKLLGWQKRAIPTGLRWPATEPDSEGNLPKYKNTSGLPKSKVLYNFDNVSREQVLVVESPLSVLKGLSLAEDETELLSNCVATLSAKISTHQMELLREFRKVVIWYDQDDAGFKGAKIAAEGLYRHTNVTVVVPEDSRDLGDFTRRDEVYEYIRRNEVPAFMMT